MAFQLDVSLTSSQGFFFYQCLILCICRCWSARFWVFVIWSLLKYTRLLISTISILIKATTSCWRTFGSSFGMQQSLATTIFRLSISLFFVFWFHLGSLLLMPQISIIDGDTIPDRRRPLLRIKKSVTFLTVTISKNRTLVASLYNFLLSASGAWG